MNIRLFARLVLPLALLGSNPPAVAQPVPDAPKAPPRLIVVISVDQFSADLFAEYRQHFTAGLKRLSEGAVFPSGYQSHAATETCPGHSTILTGNRPARTGIIANSYFNLDTTRADKQVYCAEDESIPGTDRDHYIVSPVHLLVPTMGDRMKAANPAARVVSVAGKDRAAVMMGGHHIDQVWWWSGTGFVSFSGVAETPLVAKVNAEAAAILSVDRATMSVPAYCMPHDRAIPVGGFTVGTGRFARKASDGRAFRASPEFDAAVLTLATRLVDDMKLGGSGQTDIISIGLSATDYIGHSYGTEGLEMCLQMGALDRAIGLFLDHLDAQGIDYIVALTADHGGHDLPERNRDHAFPAAQRVDAALTPKAVDAVLRAQLKIDRRLIYADSAFGDFYITKDITKKQRAKALKQAMTIYRASPQVSAVFTRDELAAQPAPSGSVDSWSLAQKARASFNPERSGDFIVLGQPWVTPIIDPKAGAYVATHGSPWNYDRRVPILFWRKGMAPFEQPLAVETVDILPTLAAQIGLGVPREEVDGRCLDLDAGSGDSCAGAR